jgi:DNA-binding NarL/FixJ family response regulator
MNQIVLKNIDSRLLIRSILNPALTQRALSRIKAGTAQAGPVRKQSLTPQEERVLALVAESLTYKEIAATM